MQDLVLSVLDTHRGMDHAGSSVVRAGHAYGVWTMQDLVLFVMDTHRSLVHAGSSVVRAS